MKRFRIPMYTTQVGLSTGFKTAAPDGWYYPKDAAEEAALVAAGGTWDDTDQEGSPAPSSNGSTTIVGASRNLTAADDGSVLECTATVTLTVPENLPANFGCVIIPSGTTSVARAGTTLLNGGGTTLTRAAASNPAFTILARASARNSYVVTGA